MGDHLSLVGWVNSLRMARRGLYAFPLLSLGADEDFAGNPMEHRSWIFRFADVEVDERNFSVTKAGEALPVEPKVFKVLQFLLHNPSRVVTKDELLDAVWSGTSVSESSLTRSVATLRRLLGDDIHEPRYIGTVPTVGYRFICDVTVIEDGFPSASTVDESRESAAEPTSAVDQSPPPEERHGPQGKRVLVVLAALILLSVAGWFAYWKWRASIPTPPVQRALTRVTFDDGLQTGATWSPDGRFIAYSSDRGGKYDIWVQQISGGDPIQITKGPGENWMPDWSPDGKYIAYRSEEGEGGIYITPALGGAGLQRKIVSFGYYPHWSPDSSRILFQTSLFLSYIPRIYVAALDGSPPREVLIETAKHHNTAFAVWHPDGKRITAWIAADAFDPTPNFSTEPIDGGPAIESRFPRELQKQIEDLATAAGTGEPRVDFRFAWAPSGKAIYFERTFRGARNIWRMIVDPVTLQPIKVERLTTSPGPDTELCVSPDGSKLAFTSEHQQLRAWAFRFEASHGRVTGPGEPVTSAEIQAGSLNLSRDGTKLGVGGQNGSWEISLPNGHEEPLVAGDSYLRDPPIWSPDGRLAAYSRWRPSSDRSQIVAWSSENRNEEVIGAGSLIANRVLYDWLPDGKSVLVSQENDQTHREEIWQLSIDPSLSGESSARRIAADRNYDFWQPHISRDGRWIVFEGARNLLHRPDSTLYAMAAAGGPWIQITDGKQWDDKPRWSPDGKTIYFLSYHRGFFNVWGVHFDPVKGRPEGEPFQITSFETPALMIPRQISLVDFSLTEGHLMLPLAQTSGNIWTLDNVDR
jgi:Tol biopolymer transport system component/DNA-binding winged helix-turn-helix (wHTH) protein